MGGDGRVGGRWVGNVGYERLVRVTICTHANLHENGACSQVGVSGVGGLDRARRGQRQRVETKCENPRFFVRSKEFRRGRDDERNADKS
jgi:hypothetical protein